MLLTDSDALALCRSITLFTEHLSGVRLRSYQQAPAEAIVRSVVSGAGRSFVMLFPRQSGKNELQAHLETYLLTLFHNLPLEIVKVSPTWKPQSLNAMRRLERTLSNNLFTRGKWSKESGYIYRLGQARIHFLSGEPTASIVGATASLLLECDEAQDVLTSKWDKDVAPMAASTNATRVFWGTAWTSQTLLAREKAAALEAQKRDGIQRVFEITADDVRQEVKAYGRFVDAEIAKHGRNHPFVKTQYFSETIDEQSGLFPAERLALMRGTHPSSVAPAPGRIYAFTIDVGGEAGNPGHDQRRRDRDSTILTIFEIDLSTLADPGLRAPTFRTVARRAWTGAGAPQLYAEINALADLWCPTKIVVDATGLGEGLAAFLERSNPGRVLPFKFSQSSKSDLGWKFIAIVESGRYKEHAPAPHFSGAYSPPLSGEGPGVRSAHAQIWQSDAPAPRSWEQPNAFTPAEAAAARLQSLFYRQAQFMTMEIVPGPGKILRYSVPDGTRDPATGELLHDDVVLSAMLCAALYEEKWGETRSAVIPAVDPLSDLAF